MIDEFRQQVQKDISKQQSMIKVQVESTLESYKVADQSESVKKVSTEDDAIKQKFQALENKLKKWDFSDLKSLFGLLKACNLRQKFNH